MPIASYLAYPLEGQAETLISEFSAHPNCSVYPSDQEEVLVLVTETSSMEEESSLQEALRESPNLSCLVMVYGDLEETEWKKEREDVHDA